MLKCLECGHLFEEGEEKRWVEPHGEELSGCPICTGAYEEIEPCEICGKYENGQDVCDECIEEHSTFENCYNYSKNEKVAVELNMFIANMIDADEIEIIIYEYLKKFEKEETYINRMKEFIDTDKDWFMDKILEGKKNEK